MELELKHLVLGNSIVCYSEDLFELRWVNLFVFSSNVESGYAKTLEVFLFQVRLEHNVFVDKAYADVEGLWP